MSGRAGPGGQLVSTATAFGGKKWKEAQQQKEKEKEKEKETQTRKRKATTTAKAATKVAAVSGASRGNLMQRLAVSGGAGLGSAGATTTAKRGFNQPSRSDADEPARTSSLAAALSAAAHRPSSTRDRDHGDYDVDLTDSSGDGGGVGGGSLGRLSSPMTMTPAMVAARGLEAAELHAKEMVAQMEAERVERLEGPSRKAFDKVASRLYSGPLPHTQRVSYTSGTGGIYRHLGSSSNAYRSPYGSGTQRSVSSFFRPTSSASSSLSVRTGFVNVGNSCYMNAVLQALLGLPTFLHDVTHTRLNDTLVKAPVRRPLVSDSCFVMLLNLAFQRSQDGHTAINTRDIKDSFGARNRLFSGYQQQDAHEFLSACLNFIHDDVEMTLLTDEELRARMEMEKRLAAPPPPRKSPTPTVKATGAAAASTRPPAEPDDDPFEFKGDDDLAAPAAAAAPASATAPAPAAAAAQSKSADGPSAMQIDGDDDDAVILPSQQDDSEEEAGDGATANGAAAPPHAAGAEDGKERKERPATPSSPDLTVPASSSAAAAAASSPVTTAAASSSAAVAPLSPPPPGLLMSADRQRELAQHLLEHSPVLRNFHCEVALELVCSGCGKKRTLHESYHDFSVDLPAPAAPPRAPKLPAPKPATPGVGPLAGLVADKGKEQAAGSATSPRPAERKPLSHEASFSFDEPAAANGHKDRAASSPSPSAPAAASASSSASSTSASPATINPFAVMRHADQSSPQLHLTKLVKQFFQPRVVEYRCECSANELRQTSSMSKLPRVLILHLKRFQPNSRGTYEKRQGVVKFDPIIDLSDLCEPHVAEPLPPPAEEADPDGVAAATAAATPRNLQGQFNAVSPARNDRKRKQTDSSDHDGLSSPSSRASSPSSGRSAKAPRSASKPLIEIKKRFAEKVRSLKEQHGKTCSKKHHDDCESFYLAMSELTYQRDQQTREQEDVEEAAQAVAAAAVASAAPAAASASSPPRSRRAAHSSSARRSLIRSEADFLEDIDEETENSPPAGASAASAAASPSPRPSSAAMAVVDEEDEEAILQRVLRESEAESKAQAAAASAAEEEDAQLQQVLAASLAAATPEQQRAVAQPSSSARKTDRSSSPPSPSPASASAAASPAAAAAADANAAPPPAVRHKYELLSVVIHKGTAASSGHYVTHILEEKKSKPTSTPFKHSAMNGGSAAGAAAAAANGGSGSSPAASRSAAGASKSPASSSSSSSSSSGLAAAASAPPTSALPRVWKEYDDSFVTDLSSDRAREAAEKEGYIFFYSYKPEPIASPTAAAAPKANKRSAQR